MSLLTIAEGLATNVGLPIPTAVVGVTERTWQEVLEHANATGEELARRVDWGQLTASTSFTGNGTDLLHELPAAFSRITKGVGVRTSSGVVRPLTQAEWTNLPTLSGVPRYFILRGTTMRFWPYLATGSVIVSYQSKNWCSNGTAEWSSDDNTSLIDENLFLKALEVRWRRAKGMDYADHEAEYEAALRDFARFNDRSRF